MSGIKTEILIGLICVLGLASCSRKLYKETVEYSDGRIETVEIESNNFCAGSKADIADWRGSRSSLTLGNPEVYPDPNAIKALGGAIGAIAREVVGI
jgi:hypothetical protein